MRREGRGHGVAAEMGRIEQVHLHEGGSRGEEGGEEAGERPVSDPGPGGATVLVLPEQISPLRWGFMPGCFSHPKRG